MSIILVLRSRQMDPEEIERLVNKLSISQEASDNTCIISNGAKQESEGRLKKCVVGKVFSSKAVNRDTLIVQVPKILQSRGAVVIEIIGDNLFIAEFMNQSDKFRALNDGPWTFFNSLMSFIEPTDLQRAEQVIFEEFRVWVQLHNLPLICMHKTVISELGAMVGRVLEVDVGTDGKCYGKYARVRVSRSLNKPLQRCVTTAMEAGGSRSIILLRYERLPDFCYACGRVGHVMKDCDDDKANLTDPQFGAWMRAGKQEGGFGRSDGGRSIGAGVLSNPQGGRGRGRGGPRGGRGASGGGVRDRHRDNEGDDLDNPFLNESVSTPAARFLLATTVDRSVGPSVVSVTNLGPTVSEGLANEKRTEKELEGERGGEGVQVLEKMEVEGNNPTESVSEDGGGIGEGEKGELVEGENREDDTLLMIIEDNSVDQSKKEEEGRIALDMNMTKGRWKKRARNNGNNRMTNDADKGVVESNTGKRDRPADWKGEEIIHKKGKRTEVGEIQTVDENSKNMLAITAEVAAQPRRAQ